MFRILLVNMCVLFLLNGCSLVVDGVLDDKDEVDGDAGPDASPMIDCRNSVDNPNGTRCGDNLICLLGECVSTRCGDGFVDSNNGESCDEGREYLFMGCLPDSCVFECDNPTDCEDGDPCTTETCVAHACGVGDASTHDGIACEVSESDAGTCSAGLCAPPNCGNGMIDAGEACDDMNANNEDGCRSNCTATCVDDAGCSNGDPCDGEETCNTVMHVCLPATEPLDCDDEEPCTVDSCEPDGCHNDFEDDDGDGYAPAECMDESLQGEDCDDADETRNPGATELCDDIDHDCNGNPTGTGVDVLCLRDQDMDGYGNPSDGMEACLCPPGFIPPRADTDVDCEDTLTSVNPGETLFHENSFGAGSYDYNCDGAETKRFPNPVQPCVFRGSGSFGRCAGGGWEGGSVPACGESGEYRGCSFFPCTLARITETIVQSCR